MNNVYSNLPLHTSRSSGDVNKNYTTFYNLPLQMDANTLSAVSGFFGGKGFDPVSSESIAVIIIRQARIDGYNPMEILDTLQGLDNAQISSLVSEILNYNRVNTSFLGYTLQFTPLKETSRNILA